MHWYKESYSLLSIYGRATLVNKLLRHRYHAVTTLLSRLNNSVDNIVRKVQLNIVHGWQHNMLQDFALYISRRTPNLWFLSQHLSTQHTTFISQYSSTSERETYVVSCVGSVEIQIETKKKLCFSITKGLPSSYRHSTATFFLHLHLEGETPTLYNNVEHSWKCTSITLRSQLINAWRFVSTPTDPLP